MLVRQLELEKTVKYVSTWLMFVALIVTGYVCGRIDYNKGRGDLEREHHQLRQQYVIVTDALASLKHSNDLRDEREALRKKTVSREITALYAAVAPVGKLVGTYGGRSVETMTDEERAALLVAIQRLCRDVTDCGVRLRVVAEYP